MAIFGPVDPIIAKVYSSKCYSYLVSKTLEIVFIEQNEAEEGPRHGPLVPAVLEHEDVEHRGQHLLQDLRVHLHHLDQGVVLGHRLTPPDLAGL